MLPRSRLALLVICAKMGALMGDEAKRAPWWLLVQLWGLDVLLAASLWGVAIAAIMQVVVVDEGPVLLLGVAAWMMALLIRLAGAVSGEGWYPLYYRSHFALMLVVTLSVVMAALWLLFFYVGQSMIGELGRVTFPLLLVFLLPLLGRIGLSRLTLHMCGDLVAGVVFAAACVVPARYLCMGLDPAPAAPLWYFSVLMGLFFMMRRVWRLRASDGTVELFVTGGLLLVMLAALATSIQAPFYERSFCVMVAMGCAGLQILIRLRRWLSADALFAIGWLVMALPPVLCMLMFTPESW